MLTTLLDELHASGQLNELIAHAALEAIAPMCGVDGSIVGAIPLPWNEPPSIIAIMSMADTDGLGTKSVAWIGGSFDALASVAEALLGERPVDEDALFEDCVRELANIVAGRVQSVFQSVGINAGLGLPIYISGARRLHAGATLVKGAAIRIRLDLPDTPELDTGFAREDTR